MKTFTRSRSFTLIFAIAILLVSCGGTPADNGAFTISPDEDNPDAPRVEVFGGSNKKSAREEECAKYSSTNFDYEKMEFIKNRTIPSFFPDNAPLPPAEYKIGMSICHKITQGNKKGLQYVIVWYGIRDAKKTNKEMLLEYIEKAKADGWHITHGPPETSTSFNAETANGDASLYFSVDGVFIGEDNKNEVFPDANVNFHVDIKVWE